MPREPQGQATEPTKSAMSQGAEWARLRVPGWLAALAAGGRACQHRPARSLHPGRGGRTRLPPRELLAARPRLLLSGQEGEAVVRADGGGTGVEGGRKPGSVRLVHQLPNLSRREPDDLIGFAGRAGLAADDAAAEDQ